MTAQKLDTCKACRLYHITKSGYCEDRGPTPKLGVLTYRVGYDAATFNDPWEQDALKYLLSKLRSEGFNKDEILASSLIRCYFPHSPRKTLPVTDSKHALSLCRQYDKALKAFAPNCAIYTYDLEAANGSPVMKEINKVAFHKTRQLVDRGYRPLLCFGKEVFEFLEPSLKGGVSDWKLHFNPSFTWRF